MQSSEIRLDEVWEAHRDYLRRVLAALARDEDLAEDLLQETYLRARNGIVTFRGGNPRPWLAAIARNVFYSHARKRRTWSETSMGFDAPADDGLGVGSGGYLDLLALRQALADLAPIFRDALILKHYGGFSYHEIAHRQGCPVGTAKRRVWTAVRRLREALGVAEEEVARMKCLQLRGTRLLDYLYGSLSERESAAVNAHIEGCPACRAHAQGFKKAINALEEFSGDFMFFDIYEVREDGSAHVHGSMRFRNKSDRPAESFEFSSMIYNHVDFIFAQGEQATFEVRLSDEEDYNDYTVRLPRPIPPGDYGDVWYVFHTEPGGPNAAEDLGGGK